MRYSPWLWLSTNRFSVCGEFSIGSREKISYINFVYQSFFLEVA